jgi:HEAT repeats
MRFGGARTRGHRHDVLFHLALLSLAILVFEAAAGEPGALLPESPTLDVAYEHAGEGIQQLLSIHAHQATLHSVVQAISTQARLRIDSPNADLLQERISVDITRLPLDQAARKLLNGFNTVFLYTSPPGAAEPPAALRLSSVILLSRKTPLSPVEQEALTRQEEATEALLESLRDKDVGVRDAAVAALKASTSERVLGTLGIWLREGGQQQRVAAAMGLGKIGGEPAVEFLSRALSESEPLTRQFAANALAEIGGADATATLLEAYLRGDSSLRWTTATAIVAHGDAAAQAALASLIAGGQISPGEPAREVLVESIRREAGYDKDSRTEHPQLNGKGGINPRNDGRR